MDIGVWGDSVVYGSCDSEGLGWVGRLRKLRTPALDEGFVYNRGVCGDSSRGVRRRFVSEFDSIVYGLDAAMFAVGMNDLSHKEGEEDSLVPLPEFQENLVALIDAAKSKVSKVYVVGITNVDEERTNPLAGSSTRKVFSNKIIETYNQVLLSICHEQAVFIDTFGILRSADLADGLHPNASGYEKLSAVISEKLSLG